VVCRMGPIDWVEGVLNMGKQRKSQARGGLLGLVFAGAERFWGPGWRILAVLWAARLLVRLIQRGLSRRRFTAEARARARATAQSESGAERPR
jgi:hypothetical protein